VNCDDNTFRAGTVFATVPVTSCTASSKFDDGYACAKAFNNVAGEWATKAEGAGSWIQAQFESSVKISSFMYQQRVYIHDNGSGEWNKNIKLKFSDDTEQDFLLAESAAVQTFAITAISTAQVLITVVDAYTTDTNNGAALIAFVMSSDTAATSCTGCPTNSGVDNTGSGATEITACKALPGFYGANGDDPTACPANSGTGNIAGSTAITACVADAGHTGSGVNVLKCVKDTFKGTASAEDCTPCPANSGTGVTTGATVITTCVANAGFYGANGDTPTACAAGKYVSTTGAAACKPCPANSGTDNSTGSTAITACVAFPGFYGANGDTPEACPANSGTGILTGSTAITACVANAGFYGANGSTPTACPVDTFKNQTGAAVCTACPTNMLTGGKTGSRMPALHVWWLRQRGLLALATFLLTTGAPSWLLGRRLRRRALASSTSHAQE
jgi:hypothetical protein